MAHKPSRVYMVGRIGMKTSETVFADQAICTSSGVAVFINLTENPDPYDEQPLPVTTLAIAAGVWSEVRDVTDEMAMKGLH